MKKFEELEPIRRLKNKINDSTVFSEIVTVLEPIYKETGNLTKLCKILESISDTHGESNLVSLFMEYRATKSYKRKAYIKGGIAAYKKLQNTLSSRDLSKRNTNTIWMKSHWLNKGYSDEAATEKIREIQSQNARCRTKSSYENHSEKIRYSLDYWIARGYSHDEAIILREPYLKDMLQDEDGFIRRYGTAKGKRKYLERKKNLIESLENSKHKRKSAGYVSKESLRFFVPLYKKCRRLRISRKEIYLGVGGSREFFIRHDGAKNHGRFFDFCIPSIGLVVEYNGVFWHPRDRATWKNPWIPFDDAMSIELEKKQLCANRNYDLFVVWDDDDLVEKENTLLTIIKERIDER